MLQQHARRIIAVDVDGVLLDTHTPWLENYNAASGDNLDPESIRGWDLKCFVRPEWCERINRLRTPELYDRALPIFGAQAGIEALLRQGHRLVLLGQVGEWGR